MFTGIVTDVGEVVRLVERNDVRRMSIATAYDAATIALGASINCAGVCLTVVSVEPWLRRARFSTSRRRRKRWG